jgi:choline dehydrogenase
MWPRIVSICPATDETAILTQPTDFVVIGAGSAGCVVTRVLAERGFSVTLIEAGEAIRVTDSPANYLRAFGTAEDWAYQTVPQPHLASRRIGWPRGRGPGGSTRINATIWYPPTQKDLQDVADAGGPTWNVDALQRSLTEITHWVAPEPPRWVSEATRRFVEAANSIELPAKAFDRMTQQGRRRTAFNVLGESEQYRSVNFRHGHVLRIDFENDTARGVSLIDSQTGHTETIRAERAIILCAGTVGSAEILVRSGIGRTDMLLNAGIDVISESSEVGENLCDHLIMPIIFALPDHHRFAPMPSVHDLARFQIAGTGPLASNLAESGLLHETATTGFQLHVTPTHYLLHPESRAPAAMTIGVNLSKPRSRGKLLWTRHDDQNELELQIDPAYLSDATDVRRFLEAIEFARSIARQSPLSTFATEELLPGAKRGGDEAMVRAIARFAQTLYHPTSTCRMGQDENSVVDEKLAVRGVKSLHVVDASILPTIPSVNPNAMVMTVALHAGKQLAVSSR